MKPHTWLPLAATILSLAVSPSAHAQSGPSGRKSLAIVNITAADALTQRMAKQGVSSSLTSVLQALDSQVFDRLVNSRRFDVMDRAELPARLQEAGATGTTFVIPKADYVLTIKLDSFNDRQETRRIPGASAASPVNTRTVRVLEASAVAKLTTGATGQAVATANINASLREDEVRSVATIQRVGEAMDDLINRLSRELALKLALRSVDFLYPTRVLARRDKTVTLNRNDASGVEVGQIWEVLALGNELTDPDTKEKSREEVYVGKVKIARVTPQNSQAEIIEDTGITDQGILRLLKAATP
jgi:curli biogenesis system outer membrane secretion channel CsgG